MSTPNIVWGTLGLAGVRVATAHVPTQDTGCTVLVFPPGAVGSVNVAGGAPATRETDLLRPDNAVPGPDAICLSGGSAPGLAAADGVLQALQRAGRGFPVGPVRVPIVSGAAVFDEGARRGHAPGPLEGATAAAQALAKTHPTVPEGRQGAGRSVSVGKLLGPNFAMPSGQAAGMMTLADLGRVAVLVVVNAVGSVRDEDGTILAGPRGSAGRPVSSVTLLLEEARREGPSAQETIPGPGAATTLAVVITDVPLSKAALSRVARMGHDGLARSIDPLHTPWDGDAVFAVSTPVDRVNLPTQDDELAAMARVGVAASYLLEQAVRRAVRLAGLPQTP